MTHGRLTESLVRAAPGFIVLACLAAPAVSTAQEDGEDPAAPALDIAQENGGQPAVPIADIAQEDGEILAAPSTTVTDTPPATDIAQEDGQVLAAPASDMGPQGGDDLAVPPRIDNVPSQARLAAPREDRVDTIEEVIVTNDNPWGLPDLGSTWRLREAQAVETGRIRANFLPLYDPDDPAALLQPLFPANREMQRVGFIQVFRVRFGGRSTD